MIPRNISEFFMAHRGRSAVLLGNGPSLLNWDLEELSKNHVTIGINRSWTSIQAYYHSFIAHQHFLDLAAGKYSPGRWIGETFEPGIIFTTVGCLKQGSGTSLLDRWPGALVAISPAKRRGDQVWWSADMAHGYHSCFGGQFAIELALWMGCAPIYLLGFDAHNQEGHHWDTTTQHVNREKQVEMMRPTSTYVRELGVEVLNANPDSAIRCFPFGAPEGAR